jgi:hypothetical protein
MSARPASETMSFHTASETTSLGLPNYVQDFPWLKHIHPDALANFKLAHIIGLYFPEVAAIPSVFQVTSSGLVESFGLAEPQLDSVVSISFLSLNLSDDTGAGLNYSYRNHSAVVPKYLGHSDFLAKKASDHAEHLCPVACVII